MQISRRSFLTGIGAGFVLSALNCRELAAQSGTYAVVIMGATPSGIMAAQAVARAGYTCCVIEVQALPGGMWAGGGIGNLDSQNYFFIGGLTEGFLKSVTAAYGSGKPVYTWEPHVASTIFASNLSNALITTMYGRTLASTQVVGGRIQSVTLDNGWVIQGSQFIDASYEGDLLAQSGTTYTYGRESSAQYGESLAGWTGANAGYNFSAYASGSSGPLIPGVNADPGETVGQADSEIQAANYRAMLSKSGSRIAFPAPPGYDPTQYVGVSRTITQQGLTSHAGLWSSTAIQNLKYISENADWFSTDYPAVNWGYADGNWTTRNAIITQLQTLIQGFFRFLSVDASVPSNVQADVNLYGLPSDEFTSNGNWPWQLYIREGRRMIGKYIMKQSDIQANTLFPDSIGLGQWVIDIHQCNRINHLGLVSGEGGMETVPYYPYQIPFRAILSNQITNLAVPVCMSMTHIGCASLRVETVYGTLGEAAGTAAGLAVAGGIDIANVSVPALQTVLLNNGGILSNPSCQGASCRTGVKISGGLTIL